MADTSPLFLHGSFFIRFCAALQAPFFLNANMVTHFLIAVAFELWSSVRPSSLSLTKYDATRVAWKGCALFVPSEFDNSPGTQDPVDPVWAEQWTIAWSMTPAGSVLSLLEPVRVLRFGRYTALARTDWECFGASVWTETNNKKVSDSKTISRIDACEQRQFLASLWLLTWLWRDTGSPRLKCTGKLTWTLYLDTVWCKMGQQVLDLSRYSAFPIPTCPTLI